jgi:hypothetical protein
MALHHFPRITTDGLVLCLDAGNPLSHTSDDSVWKDLSGLNNNVTTVRSATTPLNVGNCVGWWDASDSSTLFESNTGSTLATSTIGRWANKGTLGSAADLLQSTSNKRPSISTNIFNGLQSVLFDGIDDSLVRHFTLDASCHIFVVIKWPNPFSSIARATDGATGNTLSFLRGTSTGLGIIGSAPTSLSATTDTSYPLILEVSKNSTNSRFVINGSIQSVGNLDTTSPNGITLGSFGGGSSSYDNISFAEVIVYSDPLSIEDSSIVSSYLAAKWAIPNYANINYFNLNGTSDYMVVPSVIDATSIDVWFYMNNRDNFPIIYAGSDEYNAAAWQWSIFNFAGSTYWQPGNSWTIITSSVPINTWINAVIVRKSGSSLIYINNVALNPFGSKVATTGNLYIGKSGSNYMNGKIASLKLYNKELSPLEVSQNYNATKGRYGL